MARINVEDTLYKDQRFFDLALDFGCKFKAIGALTVLWSLGQEYWKKDCSLIPKEKFHEQKLPEELIKYGFVEEHEHGFYVRGSKKHFDWLIQRTAAGKKGGINKNNNLRASKRKQTQANASKSKQIVASYSNSNSISNSISNSNFLSNTKINLNNKNRSSSAPGEKPPAVATSSIHSEFSNSESEVKEFLTRVSLKVQEKWVKLYPPEYIQREILKALVWIENNKTRAPKSRFSDFMTNWLSRGYESYRKTVPANREQPREDSRFDFLWSDGDSSKRDLNETNQAEVRGVDKDRGG